MVNRTVAKADKVIAGRSLGQAVAWPNNDPDVLDRAISEVHIAISMVPKPIHIHVAKSCLCNRKSMLTTAYEIRELLALEKEVKEILILNEIGEVNGMDHFGTQMILDEIKEEGGRVINLNSYGSGLPYLMYLLNFPEDKKKNAQRQWSSMECRLVNPPCQEQLPFRRPFQEDSLLRVRSRRRASLCLRPFLNFISRYWTR